MTGEPSPCQIRAEVIVNGYDGKTVVNVVGVSDKYESRLGLPIERFKKIIGKV